MLKILAEICFTAAYLPFSPLTVKNTLLFYLYVSNLLKVNVHRLRIKLRTFHLQVRCSSIRSLSLTVAPGTSR